MTTNYFIVGTGRCGSTLVSEIIRDHGQIASFSEFFFLQGRNLAFKEISLTGEDFWSWLNTIRDPLVEIALNSAYGFQEILNFEIDEYTSLKKIHPLRSVLLPHLDVDPDSFLNSAKEIISSRPEDGLYSHYNHTLHTFAKLLGKESWVERSGGSLLILDELLKVEYPVKVILICRDGAHCAASMAQHGYYRSIVHYLTSRNSKLPGAIEVDVGIEIFGQLWSKLNQIGISKLSNLPREMFHVVHYEDLLQKPISTIMNLFSFMDLNFDKKLVSDLSDRIKVPKNRFEELSEPNRERLRISCEPGNVALKQFLNKKYLISS